MDADRRRGEIIYPKRQKQIHDYSGLRFGNITATDLDGYIDFGNRAFFFNEMKEISAPEMSRGQELALKRLVLGMLPKPALLVIGTHSIPAHKVVPVAEQQVLKSLDNKQGGWVENLTGETIKERLIRFLRDHGLSEYIDTMSAFSNTYETPMFWEASP